MLWKLSDVAAVPATSSRARPVPTLPPRPWQINNPADPSRLAERASARTIGWLVQAQEQEATSAQARVALGRSLPQDVYDIEADWVELPQNLYDVYAELGDRVLIELVSELLPPEAELDGARSRCVTWDGQGRILGALE